MALLLRESDVEQLLTMPVTIDLVERVHRDYSTGKASDVPRERTRVPKAGLHILQGAVPSANPVPDPGSTGVLQLVLGRSFDGTVRAATAPEPVADTATAPAATCG